LIFVASARGTQRHSRSSQVINENGENVGDMRIHVPQDSSSSFEGSGSHDARHSLSSQVINENGDASQHASKIFSSKVLLYDLFVKRRFFKKSRAN
jgi:hypothetical protein